ncbi:hypothetical protein AVEN_50744-1 [Araneus ventricosus]|uniref:Uncharacterized protein n=1 Tax=Araneus ventricosus TaxID=182803 RepID=A0A4Y2GW49_ARAVE|nr:hypothetical protein AVEN_50744-1 [Araneus ventricosus]
MAAVHKDTSSNSILSGEVEVSATLKSEPCLSSEPNLHDNIGIKHLIETGAAGDAARPVRQVAEKFGAVLRRTSKRIVLRVRDPNIEVTDKTSASQKIEDPSSESTKQGSSCGKMGRRRGGRKTLSEAVNPKSERRGRGRPRTVNRDQPAEKVGKMVSIKSSKTPKKSLAVVSQADSSSVWTLVPKELVNSDYFKSHILKMQDRPPRGRRPKKASRASHVPEIPHIPFIGRENIKVQFPKVPPVTTKPAVEQHPGPLSAPPSRPTVIYFKAQKNGLGEMEANPLVSNEITMPDQQHAVANSSEELQFSSYLRQSYGNAVNDAALGYIYGQFSQFHSCL